MLESWNVRNTLTTFRLSEGTSMEPVSFLGVALRISLVRTPHLWSPVARCLCLNPRIGRKMESLTTSRPGGRCIHTARARPGPSHSPVLSVPRRGRRTIGWQRSEGDGFLLDMLVDQISPTAGSNGIHSPADHRSGFATCFDTNSSFLSHLSY